MPEKPHADAEDRAVLERAMREVEPIGRKHGRRRVRAPRPKPGRGAPDPAPARLAVERSGERMEGRAAGVAHRELDRLRRGAVPVDARVDLHGHEQKQARKIVRDALAELWRNEGRCLLVIHGRGLRSPGRPVLKDSLPGWLDEPPWAGRVRAFVSADPARGGAGATLVLLRRSGGRQRRRSGS